MDWDSKWLISFYAEKTHRISDGCGADDLKRIDVIDKKSTFKILGLSLLLKMKRVSFIVSNAKTTSKKIGVLIHYMKQITTIFRKRIFNSFISFRKVRPKEKNRRKLRWTNIQFKMMHYTIFRLCVFIISHTRLE